MDEKKIVKPSTWLQSIWKKGIVLVSKVKVFVNWFKKNLIVISIPCYLINLKLTYIKM